jgi:hypothetical protein
MQAPASAKLAVNIFCMSMISDSFKRPTYVSKIPAGVPTKLKYVGYQEKFGEPDQYSNTDGSFGEWQFEDEKGDEVLHTHKSAKNAVMIAMHEAGIHIEDVNTWLTLTRTGSGQDTRYSIVKAEASVVTTASGEEVPF